MGGGGGGGGSDCLSTLISDGIRVGEHYMGKRALYGGGGGGGGGGHYMGEVALYGGGGIMWSAGVTLLIVLSSKFSIL